MKVKYIFLVFGTLMFMAFGLPNKIQKKVNKEIKSTYNIEAFLFQEKIIPLEVAKDLPAKFEADNFFEIRTDEELIGYAYIAKAPSKTAQFDYLVLLDKNLIVLKTRVLIYREEYGGEIGSKRWLKQFIGKSNEDELRYGDNIIAISGATISVRSMTNAMNDVLHSLKILQEKQIL